MKFSKLDRKRGFGWGEVSAGDYHEVTQRFSLVLAQACQFPLAPNIGHRRALGRQPFRAKLQTFSIRSWSEFKGLGRGYLTALTIMATGGIIWSVTAAVASVR